MISVVNTYLEEQRSSKSDRTSAFMVLLNVLATGHSERVVVNRIYLAEGLLHLRSRLLILTEHTAIVIARWVVKVRFHLVIALLVHNEHQHLSGVRCTVEIMCQNWTQAAIVIVSLNTTIQKRCMKTSISVCSDSWKITPRANTTILDDMNV